MKSYFYRFATQLENLLKDDEQFTLGFHAEQSDFVRFNQAKVRQAGNVEQGSLSLLLIDKGKCVSADIRLSFDKLTDSERLVTLVESLREKLTIVEKDPYLLINQEPHNSETQSAQSAFDTKEILTAVKKYTSDLDFVGILAAGKIHYGFANHLGQRNWYSSRSFNLDWSVYLGTSKEERDKAVKCAYGGFVWDDAEFRKKIEDAKVQLAQLRMPAISIKPGAYKAYFTPAALNEIFALLNWGGFSQQSFLTKQNPLQKLELDARLNKKVTLSENIAGGVTPAFQNEGYLKPDTIDLIKEGALGTLLCSPRTSKEYDVNHNGANASESASALEMQGGNLAQQDILTQLGTGLYIGNLWYLNYSDRSSGRFTGMTRFACFWVENGEIKAPINVVRFDDSFFNIFGENLIDLTQEREYILDSSTYEQRNSGSARLPGALVSGFKVTL